MTGIDRLGVYASVVCMFLAGRTSIITCTVFLEMVQDKCLGGVFCVSGHICWVPQLKVVGPAGRAFLTSQSFLV